MKSLEYSRRAGSELRHCCIVGNVAFALFISLPAKACVTKELLQEYEGEYPRKSNKTNTSIRARPATAAACRCSLLIQLLVVFPGDQEDFCLLKLILWRSGGPGALATYTLTVTPTPR